MSRTKLSPIFLLVFMAVVVLFGLSVAFAGEANVCWTPPTANTNGTPLTDLAGYRVVYGSTATTLDKVVQVPNPAATCQVVGNLAEGGTWYFAVKAYNSKGAESALSNTAPKPFTIPNAPTNVTVASNGLVLDVGRFGGVKWVRVGSVPAGLPCIPIPGNTGKGIAGDMVGRCGPG